MCIRDRCKGSRVLGTLGNLCSVLSGEVNTGGEEYVKINLLERLQGIRYLRQLVNTMSLRITNVCKLHVVAFAYESKSKNVKD